MSSLFTLDLRLLCNHEYYQLFDDNRSTNILMKINLKFIILIYELLIELLSTTASLLLLKSLRGRDNRCERTFQTLYLSGQPILKIK